MHNSQLSQGINRSVAELQDLGIYDVKVHTINDVFRVGQIRSTRSRHVGTTLEDGRRLIFVSESCKDEERDFHICEALARDCPSLLTVSDLLIIFTQPTHILDLMYPEGPDEMPQTAQSPLTVETEFDKMLAERLPALKEAAARSAMQALSSLREGGVALVPPVPLTAAPVPLAVSLDVREESNRPDLVLSAFTFGERLTTTRPVAKRKRKSKAMSPVEREIRRVGTVGECFVRISIEY